ncbi:LacI family DNA-binding transcriptional regulator [Actinosynnema sp.]|uniref:LacI family DNA-binding transcriptional regulator n=1 Tax=Actinosynnema sp. TaxID=1872144 RepID=UPI003F86E8E9
MAEAKRPWRAVTGSDVARLADVSQSVVSLVFSGKAGTRVSERTAERVREAAARLGYVPNTAAARLKTGRVPIIGLAVRDVSQPFFASLFQHAERRARERDHSVILITRDDGETSWTDRLADLIRAGHLGGAIAYGPTGAEAAALAATGLPVVACELYGDELPTVGFDFAPGMAEAARLLRAAGHTQVACLNTRNAHPTYLDRRTAFADAFSALGGQVTAVAQTSATDFDAACSAATGLLDGARRFTAVVCDDDLLAPAVFRAARARGWRVPEDLSVVGVGDLDLARMLGPALTTVRLPAADLATAAVATALGVIDNQRPAGTRLATALVTRDTVAAAATGGH